MVFQRDDGTHFPGDHFSLTDVPPITRLYNPQTWSVALGPRGRELDERLQNKHAHRTHFGIGLDSKIGFIRNFVVEYLSTFSRSFLASYRYRMEAPLTVSRREHGNLYILISFKCCCALGTHISITNMKMCPLGSATFSPSCHSQIECIAFLRFMSLTVGIFIHKILYFTNVE